MVGDVGNGRKVGEFPIKRVPAIVPMPWLTRSGNLFKSRRGRTTILRGVDWPYNEEPFEPPYNLRDADFARIASWGINLLRIRIAGYRSGYLPDHPTEPGYWSHLDRLIAGANRHGIYVMPSTVTGDTQDAVMDNQVYDRLKFIRGTSQRRFWLAFESAMFKRYRRWPGVVGFDTINEDDSYPPFIHDRFMMGPAHRDIDAALRAGDRRHIYLQEPSGWSYWGAEYWLGMMNGVDVGDPNRFFCPKWKADGDSRADLKKKGQLARQSKAPMFVCEYWITKTGSDGTVNSQQRAVLSAMDARLLGGVRVLYGPSDGYGTRLSDGQEAPWVQEFARPYPVWAGGRIKSIRYDFARRRLVVRLDLDGHGRTEIFTSARRTYPRGFAASSSSGARLVWSGALVLQGRGMNWDRKTQRVLLPPGRGPVTVTIAPLIR